jgi:putative sterol carrier protein
MQIPGVRARNILRGGQQASRRETIPFFADEQEVYRHIGKVFADLMEDPELVPQLKTANTIVQYRLHDPDAQITVKILEGQERQVDLGPTDLKPEVVMTMAADTAHLFWLEKVNPTVALARGEMKAKGPVEKILQLVPLVEPVFPRYKAHLEEAGRTDLIEAAERAAATAPRPRRHRNVTGY